MLIKSRSSDQITPSVVQAANDQSYSDKDNRTLALRRHHPAPLQRCRPVRRSLGGYLRSSFNR